VHVLKSGKSMNFFFRDKMPAHVRDVFAVLGEVRLVVERRFVHLRVESNLGTPTSTESGCCSAVFSLPPPPLLGTSRSSFVRSALPLVGRSDPRFEVYDFLVLSPTCLMDRRLLLYL